MRALNSGATGRNHGGSLHEPHVWKIDTLAYLELMEQGQMPLETWDYVDEEFEIPVQKLDPIYHAMHTGCARLEAFVAVPPPYLPHDLSVWACNGGVDREGPKSPKKRKHNMLATSINKIKKHLKTSDKLLFFSNFPVCDIDPKSCRVKVTNSNIGKNEWHEVGEDIIHAIAAQI
jgi:hypothetical protein